MNFEYQVTVIIPVYNVDRYLEDCLNSLLAQTISQGEMEVLMINDGSTDGSGKICERFAAEHENFKVISQENRGVSAARNAGILNAKGKYLFYLDGDDTLSSETVKNVTDFFDEHYDEVDVVSYPRVFWHENGIEVQHSRDRIIHQTKVYTLDEIPFAGFPTLNIATKNIGRDNILFDQDLSFHEDEADETDIILRERKIGYICNAKYYYRKHGNGTTDTFVNPYYTFEPTMGLYRYFFEKYTKDGTVDSYIQTIVLNDFGWKIVQDVFFPYHYESQRRERALDRIREILNHIDDDLILGHPNIDIYHRFYLLSLKDRSDLHLCTGKNAVVLCRGEHILCMGKNVTAVFTRVRIEADYVEWWGFLKSPYFLFSSVPELFAVFTNDGVSVEQPLQLIPSAQSHYKSRIQTGVFWQFCFRVSSITDTSVTLKVKLDGNPIGVKYYFMPDLSFKTRAKYQRFHRHGTECVRKKLTFTVRRVQEGAYSNPGLERWYWKNNKKFWLVRKLASLNCKRGKRIWLYYDSTGVGKDNGYYQFIHDLKQDDGVIRYYVTHDESFAESDAFEGIPPKQVVLFGTKRHKFLYLQCEKAITAYIEPYNYCPFDAQTYGHYRDINEPEVIYLQHGVLHAHQPHKYSLEKLAIDREVVSTSYEISNLIRNYHFRRACLIPAGMPRYDYIDTARTAEEKRILMAPSWRQYLIAFDGAGNWNPQHERFLASDFYQMLRAFLDSGELAKLLEKYDYTLDLKLHPIFNCYRECFSFSNPRIRLAEVNVNAEEYSIFLSDYSSFTFDFVYLKRAIVYFFPDYEQFKAGLMSYRQVDIPLEEGFGPLVQTVGEAIDALRKIFENNGRPEAVYQRRMDNFYLHYDNGQCDRIYHALMEEESGMKEGALLEDLMVRYEEDREAAI